MYCLWGQLVITSVKRPHTFLLGFIVKVELMYFLPSCCFGEPPHHSMYRPRLCWYSPLFCVVQDAFSPLTLHMLGTAHRHTDIYLHVSAKWQESACKRNGEQQRKLSCLPRSWRNGWAVIDEWRMTACVTPVVSSASGLKKASGWLFRQFLKFLWSEHRPVNTTPRSLFHSFG